MFSGFSKQAVGFMADIRIHNEKEWFEAHKQIYLDQLYHPMKELCKEVSEPFMKIDGMMSKAGRIYSDPNFPPYRKYRENMWFIVKHFAYDWSKTPSLFFELSADGAVFGFKITHPAAPVMDKFRTMLVSDGGELIKLIMRLERSGLTVGGEEYMRPKPCPDSAAEPYYQKRALSITKTVPADSELLYSPELSRQVSAVFKKLLPLNELFEEFVSQTDAEKQADKQNVMQEDVPEMPPAPKEDFMW